MVLTTSTAEYDNDPTDPEAPFRSAHDSAIFAHLPRKTRDFLGVSLPTESGGPSRRDSTLNAAGDRKSRGSVDTLRNPFGPDEMVDNDTADEDEVEVDLASWGLDSFIPKEKGTKKNKEPARGALNVQVVQPSVVQRPSTSRSLSLGTFNDLGIADSHGRSRSITCPFNMANCLSSTIFISPLLFFTCTY
jgi:hypothetical protein